jgi:transcriptional regulator with XRE-family HTH domain
MTASENGIKNAINGPQVRAARALLGWSRDQLAEESGIPKRTLLRFESGDGRPHRRTAEAVRAALEAAGVCFIPENGGGAGVRMYRPNQVRAAR